MNLTPSLQHTLLFLTATACVPRAALPDRLESISNLVASAREIHADACAPADMARAETQLAFARIEFDAADPARAAEHLNAAEDAVDLALTRSRGCGDADADKDGISDAIDACENQAEDKDGVQDEDGCPDFDPTADDDGDGILNIDDPCPTEAEDKDSDHDEDGCPEESNDSDGDSIIDAVDTCPQAAEDKDGHDDADGCPDQDDDRDGIPDISDTCPNAPEDLDQFADDDGCPDQDNDLDGVHDLDDACPTLAGPIISRGCPADDRDHDSIVDSEDQCPREPETVNGQDDQDGCPDGMVRDTTVDGGKVVLSAPLVFTDDVLAPASDPILADLAGLLADRPSLRIRLESHVDASGQEHDDDARAAKRAEQIYERLVALGVAPDRIDVVSYGSLQPIDTNRTSSGRARNRRIEVFVAR